jgi:hypothetical protein
MRAPATLAQPSTGSQYCPAVGLGDWRFRAGTRLRVRAACLDVRFARFDPSGAPGRHRECRSPAHRRTSHWLLSPQQPHRSRPLCDHSSMAEAKVGLQPHFCFFHPRCTCPEDATDRRCDSTSTSSCDSDVQVDSATTPGRHHSGIQGAQKQKNETTRCLRRDIRPGGGPGRSPAAVTFTWNWEGRKRGRKVMAKSGRRRKQDRARTESRHAGEARRRIGPKPGGGPMTLSSARPIRRLRPPR